MLQEAIDRPIMPGDLCKIKLPHEIGATLDENATTRGLPFMPEMVKYCGQTARVWKRAHKTCDSISWTGMRRMERVVHLVGLRCDGEAHGGCQSGCLLYWSDDWLTRVEAIGHALDAVQQEESTDSEGRLHLVDLVQNASQVANGASTEIQYRCQATEVVRASEPLPWYEPRQYLRDVRENGVPWTRVVWGLGLAFVNKFRKRLGWATLPRVRGPLTKTPTESLELQAGDWVRVKSHADILKTLDKSGKNRGLTFDAEMTPYCGRVMPVLRVVERIIQEDTGKLIELPGRSVILQDAICTALYHRFCPRGTFAYWREIWLERVEPPVTGQDS